MKYRDALVRIAEHFNGCDLTDDRSAMRVLSIACVALNWEIQSDDYGQVRLKRREETQEGRLLNWDEECLRRP